MISRVLYENKCLEISWFLFLARLDLKACGEKTVIYYSEKNVLPFTLLPKGNGWVIPDKYCGYKKGMDVGR